MTSTERFELDDNGTDEQSDQAFDLDVDQLDLDGDQQDLADRHALRRVQGLSTELEDVTEVEYRQLRLERVVLIGVWMSGTAAAAESSLHELRLLAETAGALVLDGFVQRRPKPDPATYVGSGKAKELRDVVVAMGADTVICDGELTPSQLVQLEKVVKVKVIDRTALILDIFAQHAKSREGKAQVELAQMQYMLPRLRGWGESMPDRPVAGWPAVPVSVAVAPVRRRSRPTGGAFAPRWPSCAARSARWAPRGLRSAASAAATRWPRWPSSATPTRASPRC